MTHLRELYKCPVCSNVIEVVQAGASALVCCNQKMELLATKSEDTGNEKHVPVVTPKDNGIHVVVGSIDHPMEQKHYIQFIEVLTAAQVLRAELAPGMKAEAFFVVDPTQVLEVREYCNLHGLWKAK